MDTPRPFDLIRDFAGAYYDASCQGANMRLAANALETMREALESNRAHLEVRSIIDDRIGRADIKVLAPILNKLRARIFARLDQHEVLRLRAIFEKDANEGWKAWLSAYTGAFSEWGWYTNYCRKLAQDALLWVPEHSPSIRKIRYYTQCAHYGLWAETYDWFLFLSQKDLPEEQQILPKEQRGHMLATAAEIQIYHFYQPTSGEALLKEAQTLVESAGLAVEKEPSHAKVLAGGQSLGGSYRIDQVWGEFYLQTEQPELARPYFERIIASKPSISTGYTNLGDYFTKIGDLRLAEEQYELAVEKAPGSTSGYQSLADLLTKVDWYSDRDARLQAYLERMQLITDDPAYPNAIIGGVYRTLADYENAVRLFKESIRIDRREANAYIALGHFELEHAGRQKETEDMEKHIALAVQTFRSLMEIAPRSFSGYWGMMFVELQKNNLDGALTWLKKARRCHPQWASYADATQGELLRQQGKLAEARRYLVRSLKREAVNPNALSSLRSLSDDYKPKDAKIAIQLLDVWRNYAGEAEEYTYQNQVGNVWYYYADYQRATEHYRLAIARNAKSAVLFSNLALALERTNTPDLRLAELDEALQALEIAIQLNPAEVDYSSRYQRMKIERDFIAACGEAALRFEHVIVPMRLAGQTDLITHLLNASRDALSDAVLNELDTIRTRVREHLGVQPPPVLISYLPGDDIPTGKYAISVKEQVVEEAVLVGELENAQFVQAMLLQRLEDMEEKHLVVFAGYQEIAYLLATCQAEACQTILTSPRLLTAFMLELRARLQDGNTVKELEQIALKVLQAYPVDQSSRQSVAGNMGSTPDQRELESDYPTLVLFTGKLPGIGEAELKENLLGVQNALFTELGVITPSIQLVLDEKLPDNTFRLQINGEMQATVVGLEWGEVWVYLSMDVYQEEITKALEALKDNLSARESVEPNTGDPAVIIKPSFLLKSMLTAQGTDIAAMMREYGLDVRDRIGYITFCVAADVRRNAAEMVTPGIVHYLLSKLEAKGPYLISAARQEIGLEAITQELRRRLVAHQPIHDLPAILEELLVANFQERLA